MAGRGRPRKSKSQHELDGTYRADRHQRREPTAEGEPYQIIELSGVAAALWHEVVPRLVAMQVAKEIDSLALCTMCRLVAKLHDVLDDEEADEYKRSTATSALLKQLSVLLAKFGMTPVDRKAMSVDGTDEENPFAAFLMGLHGSEAAQQQGPGRAVHRRSTPRKDRRRKAG